MKNEEFSAEIITIVIILFIFLILLALIECIFGQIVAVFIGCFVALGIIIYLAKKISN
jgi:hypothetical protein